LGRPEASTTTCCPVELIPSPDFAPRPCCPCVVAAARQRPVRPNQASQSSTGMPNRS
jgi:hypothetical protein